MNFLKLIVMKVKKYRKELVAFALGMFVVLALYLFVSCATVPVKDATVGNVENSLIHTEGADNE